MPQNKFKLYSQFTIKSNTKEDSDTITIEGFASTTAKDRDGDVVAKEAWEGDALKNYTKNPIVLAFHDHRQPIGVVKSTEISEKGLHIVADIYKSAGRPYKLVKDEVLKSFSIGFRVKDADWDEATDIFVIKDLELFEISVVSVPANQDSIFSLSKYYADKEDEYMELKQQFKKDNTTAETEEETSIAGNKQEEIMPQTQVTTGAEKLLEELQSRLEAMEVRERKAVEDAEKAALEAKNAEYAATVAKNIELSELIDGLRNEIKEKKDEIEAIQKSKMTFGDKNRNNISEKDIDTAVLVAKAMGKKIEDTKFGKSLIEKATVSPHLTGLLDGWEETFSTRVYNDMRDKLVVEPLFNTIAMPTPTMYIPINPEAGTATWIQTTAYRSTDGSSTGTAVDHAIGENSLASHKLAAKEYLGYEEDEDSIVPLMPIVRDAVVRRMARSADIALLRGVANGTTDPIAGLTKIANTDSHEIGAADQPSVGTGDAITVAHLQATRRLLGRWGLNPSEVVYLVSEAAYYDLLEDPDFRTVDLVGDRATILTGQIGFVSGSPVIVSDSFVATPAAGVSFCAAVNTSNFLVGNHRGIMVERDRDIENQKNILVVTRRMGFLQIISGQAVASGIYKA